VSTVRCWKCGAVIPVEDARRVTVTTGRTYGQFGQRQDGTHTGYVSGSTYERVDFCPGCFATRRRNGSIAVVFLAVVGAGVAAWIQHLPTQPTPDQSAHGQPNATKDFQAPAKNQVQQKLAEEKQKQLAEEKRKEDAQQKLAEEKRKEKEEYDKWYNSPEQVAKRKADASKAKAHEAKALAAAQEREAERLLGLAKAQLADGEARLQKATTATAGKKLLEFGMKRLEDIIDRYPQTQAAAEAKQLLVLRKE
jgi:hypothetical protein